MKNSDMPAMPIDNSVRLGAKYQSTESLGLTKREQACITLGIPESGDPDLDEIIKKSERKRIATVAMGAYLDGNLSWTNGADGGYTPPPEEAAKESVSYADALLKELSK